MFSIPNFRCGDFDDPNINGKSKDESRLEVLASSLLYLSSQTFVLCTPTSRSLSLLSPFHPPTLVLQNDDVRAVIQVTDQFDELTRGDCELEDLERLRSALAIVCTDFYGFLLDSPGPRIYW